MTTANRQTAHAPATQEQAEAEDGDIHVTKYGLMSKPQKDPDHDNQGDFVVVTDDLLLASYNLRGHDQDVKDQDHHSGDAQERQLRQTQAFHEQHGLHEAQQQAGVTANLEAGPALTQQDHPRSGPRGKSATRDRS